MGLKDTEVQALADQSCRQACALSRRRVRIEISKPNQRNSLVFNVWKSQSAQNHFDSKRWNMEPLGNANGFRRRPARHTKSRNDLHGGNHYKRPMPGRRSQAASGPQCQRDAPIPGKAARPIRPSAQTRF